MNDYCMHTPHAFDQPRFTNTRVRYAQNLYSFHDCEWSWVRAESIARTQPFSSAGLLANCDCCVTDWANGLILNGRIPANLSLFSFRKRSAHRSVVVVGSIHFEIKQLTKNLYSVTFGVHIKNIAVRLKWGPLKFWMRHIRTRTHTVQTSYSITHYDFRQCASCQIHYYLPFFIHS